MQIDSMTFTEETGQVIHIGPHKQSPDLAAITVSIIDEEATDAAREKAAERAAKRLAKADATKDTEKIQRAREAADKPVEPVMSDTRYLLDVADWVPFLTRIVTASESTQPRDWSWEWRTASGMASAASLGTDGLVLTSSSQSLIGPDGVTAIVAYAKPVIAAEAARAKVMVKPIAREASMSALLGGARRIG